MEIRDVEMLMLWYGMVAAALGYVVGVWHAYKYPV